MSQSDTPSSVNSAGITFEVSSLKLAEHPLDEMPYRKAVEHMVKSPVESCPLHLARLVPSECNGLMWALHLAFMDHRPVSLSPDHIWLAICQGVAVHVNQNAETLRKHFVSFEGKKELRVRRDDFVRGTMENPWVEVWPEFVEQLREHIGDVTDQFLPEFTTTGIVERAACQITLMDAMQSYFEYVVETRCGIPRVTLEGSPRDWAMLRERARVFEQYDLAWWTGPLDEFLAKLHESSLGKIDQEWWRSFYKWQEASGGAEITGHVMNLFPYVFESQQAGLYRKNPRFVDFGVELAGFPDTAKMYQRNPELFRRVRSDILPPGISKAPFTWEYLGKPYDYEFIGGFLGVKQMPDLTLRPEIGWAVRPKPAAEVSVPPTVAKISAPQKPISAHGVVTQNAPASFWTRFIKLFKQR